MSWRSKGLPLAILAIFLIQITSPMIHFPVDELEENQPSAALTIGFSTGSGHDLEGDVINVDGKNWTVRGESILDYWSHEIQNQTNINSVDMVLTDVGIGYACSTNSTEVYFHTLNLDGSFDTLVVQNLGTERTDSCAIGVTTEDRIQIAYGVDDDENESTASHVRLARLAEKNAVYLERTWHIRTIAESVYDSGSNSLNLEFDDDSRTHIFFRQTGTHGLHHLWFNKAFWNHTLLDDGPIGSDIEIAIDADNMFHLVYTVQSESNLTEGEVRLLRFNETSESRQVLARGLSVSQAVGMDLDSNNIEQIAYSSSNSTVNTISLLRSLAGKDTGRINPTPSSVITYDDDSLEGEVLSGDLNGDGMDDLVYTDPEGNGTISIHYGSPNGPADLPSRMLVGSLSDSNLGFGMAVGDFNCDGFDDIASSEPGLGTNNSGYVSIRLGSSIGIATQPWWDMTGNQDDNLGWSLTSLGDVESDGCDDLAIVADKLIEENEVQPTLSKNGLVMILKGNSTSMVEHSNITQTDSGTMFGRQVATGGDFNGDGYLDMVVSNTGTQDSPTGYSSVEFFMGNESGINSTPVKIHSVASQGKLYGFEMSFVGDVHGDGYDDLIISELFASTTPYQSGKVHMWSGSETIPVANWTLKGPFANALIGYTISPAGDINEDGYSDFFLMMPSASKSGTVNLYLGSENGVRNDVQLFAQGSAGQNVGLNLLTGMDLNGDGMGELLYSSRDLNQGDNFAPVLTIMSERDWENVDFEFPNEVEGIDLHTPQRGSPSLLVELSDSSLMMLENTPDGVSSAGRWDHRYITDADSAVMGITDSGKPTILAIRSIMSIPTLVTMSVEGNTGLDFSLDTGTGLGKEMGTAMDINGMQRIGHFSPSYSSIFYTVEGEYGYSTSLVRSTIDILYPINVHVDASDKTRMVYVDDDDHMVRLATLDGTWSEDSVLNTTIGDDFDSVWTFGGDLLFAQIAISNNSTYLQLVEYNGTDSTVEDIVEANTTAAFELELVSGKLVLSVLDGEYLRVYERELSGGNWTVAHERWMLFDNQNLDNTLVMRGGNAIYDFNNSDQGVLQRASDGNWSLQSIDVPDSLTPIDFIVDSDRWHVTSTDDSMGSNNLVWTTGSFSDTTITTSTKFSSIVTEHMAGMDLVDGDLVIAYSQSSTNDFSVVRIVSDTDRDLIPDTHDGMPNVGNQWEDSDSDGFGDNTLGPQPDACVSEFGESIYDRFGCDDYDEDGWSDANDDCVNNDGTSWWGQLGCSDDDQDGWVDDAILGDRYPENWKQALDTDRDTFGDNHGPDCCNVTLESTPSGPGDLFPYNPLQQADRDGDGYGDNPNDPIDGDWCWFVEGYSWRDRQGCPDSDSDGSSDPWYNGSEEIEKWGLQYIWTEEDGADWWPNDSTQWADSDGDGFGDNSSEGATTPDKFPAIPAAAHDTDRDGYPDNWTALDDGQNRGGLFLDNCPKVWGNSTSTLSLIDGILQPVSYYGCQDTDGDGREDTTDAFPADPTQIVDSDGDGWGDNQQGNNPDACPFEPGVINGTKPNGETGIGCPIFSDDPDEDQDGVPDDTDDCPNTPFGQTVNEIGCSEYQIDDDLDGVSNAEDRCADTPIDTAVDGDGCSTAQKEVDTDGDGINDPSDLCPDTNPTPENVTQASENSGCALYQLDSDDDGVTDDVDECEDTFPPVIVLANGCIDESKTDEDIDGDGYKGNYTYFPENNTHVGDAFPFDKTQWQDIDGDGFGDNASGERPDYCPDIFGKSDKNERYGCLDTDGDGYSDILGDDLFEENPTQWEDADKDGWGDNQTGTEADQCLDTNWQNEVFRLEAENNFGCAAYQSDSDNDGITDDNDACPNTPAGAEVYPSGCKIEAEAGPTETDDSIFGMDPVIFYAAAGGGGLLFLGLVFIIISRMRGDDFEFDDDDDDDDWFDDDNDNDDDFMSGILGNRGKSREPASRPQRGPQRGPAAGPQARGPSRGPPGSSPQRGPSSGPSRGPPGGSSRGPSAGPNRGSPSGPSRGPSAGPNRGPSSAGPARGPDPRGPQRGGSPSAGASAGKKVAKRKPVGEGRVRKAKVQIDPDLFDTEELADRAAAVDWTKTALRGGISERSILMQLQTTGWSAPQSRAIIDLSKE